MRHLIYGAFLLLMMTGFSYAVESDAVGGNTPVEIHVGIYAPFSNGQAVLGRHILGAVEMARDQLKSSTINYTFYTLDQISNKRSAADTLQKFINVHKINVLLTGGTVNGLVAAPLARKNNIIHFSMATDRTIADGKNNFLALNPATAYTTVLSGKLNSGTVHMKPEFINQFKESYLGHNPSAEAGYAYDVFHILHKSTVIAMKGNPDFSSKNISYQIHALAKNNGVMGSINFDKNGVLT